MVGRRHGNQGEVLSLWVDQTSTGLDVFLLLSAAAAALGASVRATSSGAAKNLHHSLAVLGGPSQGRNSR